MSRVQISSQADIDYLILAEHQEVDLFGNVEVHVPKGVVVHLPDDIYWDVSGEGVVSATSGRLTLHGAVTASVSGDAVVQAFDTCVVDATGEAHVQLFDSTSAGACERARVCGTSDNCRAVLIGREFVYAEEATKTTQGGGDLMSNTSTYLDHIRTYADAYASLTPDPLSTRPDPHADARTDHAVCAAEALELLIESLGVPADMWADMKESLA